MVNPPTGVYAMAIRLGRFKLEHMQHAHQHYVAAIADYDAIHVEKPKYDSVRNQVYEQLKTINKNDTVKIKELSDIIDEVEKYYAYLDAAEKKKEKLRKVYHDWQMEYKRYTESQAAINAATRPKGGGRRTRRNGRKAP